MLLCIIRYYCLLKYIYIYAIICVDVDTLIASIEPKASYIDEDEDIPLTTPSGNEQAANSGLLQLFASTLAEASTTS